jgi:hypothetical protein
MISSKPVVGSVDLAQRLVDEGLEIVHPVFAGVGALGVDDETALIIAQLV